MKTKSKTANKKQRYVVGTLVLTDKKGRKSFKTFRTPVIPFGTEPHWKKRSA